MVGTESYFSLQSVVARLQSLGVQNGAPVTGLQSEQEESQLKGLGSVSMLF